MKKERKSSKVLVKDPEFAAEVTPIVETPPLDSLPTQPVKKTRKSRRMPRAVREQMVIDLDRAIGLVSPLTKSHKKATGSTEGVPPPSVKEIAKQLSEILKAMRVSLRVRARKGPDARPTSVFNLFVRETMQDMKAKGIVFGNTTERMQECGRLWRLRKAELLAAAVPTTV